MYKFLLLLTVPLLFAFGCTRKAIYSNSVVYNYYVAESDLEVYHKNDFKKRYSDIKAGDTLIAVCAGGSQVEMMNPAIYRNVPVYVWGVPKKARLVSQKKVPTQEHQERRYATFNVLSDYDRSGTGSSGAIVAVTTPSTVATIQTGPRGGKYYFNSKGNKTYIKRK